MINFAYIDAGTGSMLIQVTIASIIACSFFFKQIFAAIRKSVLTLKSLFKKA